MNAVKAMPSDPESKPAALPQKLVQFAWTTPSVYSAVHKVCHAAVMYESPTDGRLRILCVDKGETYKLTPPQDSAAALAYLRSVWDAAQGAMPCDLVAVVCAPPISESRLRKALYDAGYTRTAESEAREREKEDYAGKGSGLDKKRRSFALDHVLPFGKWKGETIRACIDSREKRGWIEWALKEIGQHFLDDTARAYYAETVKAARKNAKG